ncbi:hypothetical protein ACHAWO_013004 [Cyclotella atomus]|uniref:ATP synthase protein I n=1 Tax=Cyclotella atomus TaxID=382360 RepID=A0ABD3Q2M4_9STRA
MKLKLLCQKSLLLIAFSVLQVVASFAPSPSRSLRKGLHKSCKFHGPINKLINTTGRRSNHWQIQATDEEKEEQERKKKIREEIFWAKQRALAAEMSAKSDATLKKENKEKYEKRVMALTSDTLYFSILIASLLWLLFANPFVSISYLFGALSGTAYSYGLGKYVQTIGGTIDDVEAEGAGIGQARFAFLILLFVAVGRFRDQGLLEIPSIMGFFTYQLASLGQGLREIDD